MNPLDDAERALVADVLSGERNEDDAEVAARLQANPTLRTEIAALRRVADDLTTRGAERRDEIAAAQSLVASTDVERARQAMTAWRSRERGASRRRRMRWVGLAAALLIAVVALALLRWGDSSRRNDRLGDGGIAIEIARGADGRLSRFEWPTAKLPENGFFQLELRVAVGDRPRGAPFLISPQIESQSWILTQEDTQRIEREPSVHCELLATNAFGASTTLGTLVLRPAR